MFSSLFIWTQFPLLKQILYVKLNRINNPIEEALGVENVVVDIQQVSDDELGSMTVLATKKDNIDWISIQTVDRI